MVNYKLHGKVDKLYTMENSGCGLPVSYQAINVSMYAYLIPSGAHMRVRAVERQERHTPTHLIKLKSTHGRVSKDRLVIADGTRTSVSCWLELSF